MQPIPQRKSHEIVEAPANKAKLAADVYAAVLALNMAMHAAASTGLLVEPGCTRFSCGPENEFSYDSIVVRVCEHITF